MATNAITEKQRQTWNKFSGGWKKWDTWVINWLAPIGEKLLTEAELKETDRVLDVSTGTGEPGLTAATRVAQVVATDVAEDMVEIARTNAEARELRNFQAKVADAENLPFSDSEFDAAICRLGVIYFANPEAGVKEITRVVKPGRKLALAAWSEPTKNPWATTAAGVINKILDLPTPHPDAPGVFRCNRPGLLTELLEQADVGESRCNCPPGVKSIVSERLCLGHPSLGHHAVRESTEAIESCGEKCANLCRVYNLIMVSRAPDYGHLEYLVLGLSCESHHHVT